MAFPVDKLPESITDADKELIQTAHKWITTFLRLQRENEQLMIPTPSGTLFEAWALLQMVFTFRCEVDYFSEETNKAVATSSNFDSDIAKLVANMEGWMSSA
jgi:hypothetical protein